MKKVLFSLWLLIGLVTTVFAQAFEIEWSKNYGGSGYDYPDQIKKTADGGYIVSGVTRSNDGDLSINPYSTVATWLLKLDMNGNMEWSKVFGDFVFQSSYFSSVYPTTDGGYILAKGIGEMFSSIKVIYKLDESGEITWQNTYDGNGFLYYIQQTEDNGYIVLIDEKILKLNESGETEWEKEFEAFEFSLLFIKQISTGNYIVGGSKYENINIGYVNMLNQQGELLWETQFQEEGFDIRFLDGIETADGNLLFVGYRGMDEEGSDSPGYFAVKVNQSGETIWSNTYGGAQSEWAHEVQQTEDGGYILSGISESFDGDVSQNLGLIDNWVVRIDAEGNLLCERSFGGTQMDGTYNTVRNTAIEHASNGGFVLATGSQSSDFDVPGNKGDYDFWIYKINLGDCEMSISETDAEALTIYPNPVKNILHFSVYAKEIAVYDLQGKLVKFQKEAINQLDISTLSKGNYILNLTTENGQKVTHKIIKE